MELQSANLSELMPELIQAISQLGNLSKDKQGYGYKYAELSKVLDTCRPILAEHNLVITQLVTVLNDEPTLVTTLFHKSGQFLRSCYPLVKAGVKQANDAQQVGAAITYARRYALTAMLFMAQEDDDAASVGKREQSSSPKSERPNNSNKSTPQAMSSTQANVTSKSIIEQLKDRLKGKTKEECGKIYDKSIVWLKEKHPDLVDEYNLMYNDYLLNLM
ncbi:ERF family protein [Haemophilus parainfluenzae]|uniref:ERF superfamily n=1 Tax=Haemophilus parainfluenzae TaxID=729 RepID=A0A377JKU9_HAEPA|nr:ERF family protein [Haemophilus parainfluenzae]STP06264.1 ERF superfamily [Haemophilus parainfluenzae]STP06341.1 ERF superfamily [Haemophilus parainfluenzae]